MKLPRLILKELLEIFKPLFEWVEGLLYGLEVLEEKVRYEPNTSSGWIRCSDQQPSIHFRFQIRKFKEIEGVRIYNGDPTIRIENNPDTLEWVGIGRYENGEYILETTMGEFRSKRINSYVCEHSDIGVREINIPSKGISNEMAMVQQVQESETNYKII